MELADAEKLARDSMRKHGLTKWKFKWDRAAKRFGLCQHSKKTISLSSLLTLVNDESKVNNTILHEIAHALVGPGHGHDRVWKAKAISIGCNGNRCFGKDVTLPTQRSNKKAIFKYQLTCPMCGIETQRIKKPGPTLACAACCRKYNRNKWSEKFLFNVKKI